MAFPFFFLLLASVAAIERVHHGTTPKHVEDMVKGVDWSFAASCEGDPSLLPQMINDGYCDCSDGSDEPGTSACAGMSVRFRCRNQGFEEAFIPTSRVNDGVCDCCDGSDELDLETGESPCDNACASLAAVVIEGLKEEVERVRKGWEKREQLLEGYREDTERQRKRKEGLNREAKQLDFIIAKIEVALTKQERLEQEERINAARGISSMERVEPPSADEAEGDSDIDTKSLDQLLERRFRTRDGKSFGLLDFIEKVDREASADIQDIQRKPTVSELRKKSMLYPLLKGGPERWSALKSYAMDGLGLALYPARLVTDGALVACRFFLSTGNFVLERMPAGFQVLVEPLSLSNLKNMAFSYLPKAITSLKTPLWWRKLWNTGPRYFHYYFPVLDEELTRPEAEEMRSALTSAQSAAGSINEIINAIETSLDADYGPDGAYYFPKDKTCFDMKSGEYKYSFCIFDEAKQGTTSLGKWTGWKEEEEGGEKDYTVMKFEGGKSCWKGPERSATVHLKCAPEEKLVSIREPSICLYDMIFHTPRACHGDLLASLESRLETLIADQVQE